MVERVIRRACGERGWHLVILKYLAAFLIPMILAIISCCYIDNDSWGLLAEGRYIVEHGLYQTDVLSIHETPIIVSNYAFAVVFWCIYSLFGAFGLYLCMLLLNCIVCFLIYKICILFSRHNVNLSLAIMMMVDILLVVAGFIVTRAQMLTFVLMLGLIYSLELYIESGKTKYLLWAPLISLVQINFHASYWWFLIVIMIVFIIDSFKCSFLPLQGYRKRPLLVSLLTMILIGLINPYGILMIVSIFSFYFDGTLNVMVDELQAYSPFMGVWAAIVYLAIVAVSYLYLRVGKKCFKMRYFLMYFGFLALALNTVKAFSQFFLVMGLPLAWSYSDVSIERIIPSKRIRRIICGYIGGMVLAAFVAILIYVTGYFPQSPRMTLVEAVDAIDDDLADVARDSISVYTGFNDGGYIEYRGYKAYLDPRGDPAITKEWQDFLNGKVKTDELLGKYEFDYIIVSSSGDPFYELNNNKCKIIYGDENTEKVFRCFE